MFKTIEFSRKSIFVWMIILLFTFCSSSQGEEVAKGELEEMVVTSTMTKHQLMGAPTNVVVITREDIQKMDAKTVADVLKKLPGIFYSNASGLEPHLSLRGTRIGMSGGALVLLNGIPMNLGKFAYTDFESIPVENVERIEVVKGPLSALYGGDAARGVINIITRKGKKRLQGNVSVIRGSYDDQRYSALLYGSTNKLYYNLNLKKREQESFRDYTSLDGYYFNGEIGYWMSDESRISLFADAVHKKRLLPKRLTEAEREKDPSQSPDYSLTKNRDYITGITFKTNKEMFDVDTTIYYKTRDKLYDNYKLAVLGTPYEEDLNEYVYGARSIVTYKHDIFSKKNLFSFGFDYDHDYIDIKKIKAAAKNPLLPYTIIDPKYTGDFTRKEIGVFLQDEFYLTSKLIITGGIRYDYFKFYNDAQYDFTQGGKLNYDTTPSYDKINPRIGITYRIRPSLNLYANFSRAYRAPNIYDYYASAKYSSKYGYTLKPETFTQYEGGIRLKQSSFFNLDFGIYKIIIEDMLDLAYNPNGKYVGKRNIAEATIKGIETTIYGSPFKRFNYKIYYCYTDARYTAPIFSKIARGKVVNIDGNRLTKVPYNKLNIDLNTKLLSHNLCQIWWYFNIYAQSNYEMDAANTDHYPGYALLNTKLNLKYKKLSAFVAVNNILDKDYDAYAYRSYSKNYYYPAAGRTYAVGIKYSF